MVTLTQFGRFVIGKGKWVLLWVARAGLSLRGGGGSARRALNLRKGLAAAVAASALLVGVAAVPVGAENDNPCQVYQDEVALQEARLEASPSWPRHYLAQAREDLQTCADRYPDRFAGPLNDANRNDPGKLLNADGDRVAVVPAQPSASQVQSYTYSWLNNPYCGWTGNGVPKDCGRTQEQYDAIVARGGTPYRPPIGGGPNGTVSVPCHNGQEVVVVNETRTFTYTNPDIVWAFDASGRRDDHRDFNPRNGPLTFQPRTITTEHTGNFTQRDADGNPVTTRRPPGPGYSCW